MNQYLPNRKIKIYSLEDFGVSVDQDFSINIFQNLEYKNKKWSVLSMNHFSTLILIRKGKGHIEIDSKKYTIEDFGILYLPYYVSHRGVWTDVTDGLVIQFYDSFLTRKNEFPANRFSFFLNTKSPIVVNIKDCTIVWGIIKFLKKELKLEDKSEKGIIRNLSELLFLYLNRYIQKDQKLIPIKSNRTVYDFFQLLNSSQGEIRSVNHFASQLGITPGHLSDTVKELTGKSASDFIKENVIRRAIRLLENTDERISDIASQLNFQDSAYFTRFFKKKTGLSPSEFRKNRNPTFVHTSP
ncbi:helix-turn-helix domain-containing protein [Leptospira sp. 85282-16]|uniref:AraC family transcriptional regulator n=1 Tax=Leptospira montravelensis TaxID=2484961 RepID=A0ABY2LS24_9LEPT|nr:MULTISPECIES: helix-turn-helix domain-containing protein [Leptospira]MCT8335369.1 helix-turn-helix domain-containing protein [Leptospira sp. 85282-16]TGK78182.1 AraC family transcriptional regulator [Leptospira montravelensis]TGL03772.1 AraC family transcriptional regulator [Leptospira montravelensis]